MGAEKSSKALAGRFGMSSNLKCPLNRRRFLEIGGTAVAAASIVSPQQVRGSAANSAVRIGLLAFVPAVAGTVTAYGGGGYQKGGPGSKRGWHQGQHPLYVRYPGRDVR